MTRTLILALGLLAAPMASLAMPVVGDIVGTNPTDASAAMEKAGCPVSEFEAEDGKIEAVCVDAATNAKFDVMIDPATGAITEITASDD